jgi:hypothetical protein
VSKIKKDDRFEAKEKQKYTVTNWSTYNKALENRGDITFMISDEVIANWYSDEPLQRGAQEKYSDTCIVAFGGFTFWATSSRAMRTSVGSNVAKSRRSLVPGLCALRKHYRPGAQFYSLATRSRSWEAMPAKQ